MGEGGEAGRDVEGKTICWLPLTRLLPLESSFRARFGANGSLISYLAPCEFKAISETYLAELAGLAVICPVLRRDTEGKVLCRIMWHWLA